MLRQKYVAGTYCHPVIIKIVEYCTIFVAKLYCTIFVYKYFSLVVDFYMYRVICASDGAVL